MKWQDGAPFTADDVVFSQSAVMNPKNDVGTRTGYDHFCSEPADAAQRVALQSNDRALRARAYATIQRELDAGAPYIPMWFDRRIDAMNDDLRNYRPAHAATTWTAPWEWQV